MNMMIFRSSDAFRTKNSKVADDVKFRPIMPSQPDNA
jgi:hypothetical protein